VGQANVDQFDQSRSATAIRQHRCALIDGVSLRFAAEKSDDLDYTEQGMNGRDRDVELGCEAVPALRPRRPLRPYRENLGGT
jgi:hypothetical protein